MKFCSKCGVGVHDEAVVCVQCGCPLGNYNVVPAEVDASSAGFSVLCFFYPIVGLILYLVWKPQFPKKAKSCGMGALIGVIVNAAAVVLFFVFYIIIIAGIIALEHFG